MSKMISVASGFQYSVNIGYDLNNDDKLKNFIPTKSALTLLKDILSSTALDATERARVLVGAYGKGKSHIILTILSVLMQRDRSLFTHLMPKINEDPELKQLVDNYYSDKNNRILPVIINGTSGSLPQAFLLALQRTLDENGLDIMPETNYRAAINAIQKWKADYPKTYDKFKKEISLPVDAFISELNDYNAAIYSEFEEVYPKLTSGSIFNPFVGFDVVELYESVVKSLKQRGYLGIYVVYDEFSKFLESNITAASVSDTKMLQDFAEKCNRSSENELHLLLISHKEISNYIDQLPKAKVDGWRGVSERFRHIHLNNNFAQTYEIISTVIIKDRDKWEDFQDNNIARFDQLMSRYAEHAIFSDTDQKELETTIYECYPLHPVSTFILPRLSERVAQNERTLFTFLSADGTSTLPAFLRGLKDKDFRVITPDLIFDYFDPVLQKEPFAGELHKNYVLTKTILDQIEDQILESKIVKTISLIYLLGQFDKLKPIKEEIVGIYSMEYKPAEIEAAIEHLIKDEYVIYLKRSNDYLKLKQTSGVDVEQKISDTIAALAPSFSLKSALKDFNASMSPFFSLSLIKRALEVLSRHDYSGKDIPFIRDKTIEYLLKQKVCLCGTHLDEGSVPYEKVKSLLDVIPPKSLSTYVTDFKKESKRRAGAIQDLVEQMQENLATASQQSDDIMDKTDELHKIEAKLSGEDVSEKVRAINNEIQICVKTINKCNNDRDKLNRERGGLEKERERADTERQNLTLLDEKNRKTQMYLTYARKIYEELENVYRTSEEEIRNRLQDTINDIFKQIYEGGLSLTIDSKYHITVQANDYEGDVETSTAQSISVIFAFITGIIKMARENRNASDDDAKLLSSEPYPLVMDAPLSAFDKRRIKTVCEALPETAEQVIIFIKDTDGELAEDYMGNRIGSRHQFDKKNEFETNLV